jgi:trans-aconitate methyltransferase
MDNPVCEWDAEDYAKGNRLQEELALTLLKKYVPNLAGQCIFDGGCGTGNISAAIAQDARYVHGIDASNNMIFYANAHYGKINNLTFNQCCLENFSTDKPFDKAVSFSCLHWIKNKQKAFQKLYDCLKPGGELLCTIAYPMENGIEKQTFNEMFPPLQQILSIGKVFGMEQAFGSSYLTPDEVKLMVENIGFIIKYLAAESFAFTFKDRQDIIDFEHPVIMTTPIAKMIPTDFLQKKLFDLFIDKFEKKLSKNDDGSYIYPNVRIIILHAQKEHAL